MRTAPDTRPAAGPIVQTNHRWPSATPLFGREREVAEIRGLLSDVQLTARKQAVSRLLVDGQSDREIADQLSISPRTASSHVGRILAKLDVRTRPATAIRDGLV